MLPGRDYVYKTAETRAETQELYRLYTFHLIRYNKVVARNTINLKAVKGWYRKCQIKN